MAAIPKLRSPPYMNMNPTPRSNFSTTPTTKNINTNINPNKNPNINPSYPRFSLKRISPNPRVRMALGAGLALLAVAEGYAWVKFWPRITGKGRGAEGGEGEV